MKGINTSLYGVGQGIKNIGRNRVFSCASIATMAACLFLFGIFYSIIVNFRSALDTAEQKVGITVFFNPGITEEEIGGIGASIRTRAEVASISYTSAEEAWENYKAGLPAEELATFGEDNPLEDSASYTVYMNDVEMQDSLVRFISNLAGVRKVNEEKDLSKSFSVINKIFTTIAVAIVVILLAVAIFLINITISTGIKVRQREISIMKLIGATDHFIRTPYVVEGILIGLIGAVIPSVVMYFCYGGVTRILGENFSSFLSDATFVDTKSVMIVLIPVALIIGIGIGYIGSSMALGRQLKKIEAAGNE
ncbi:MAG: permease-like cell division protein FtsX [Lachnospiraceae bacterium]|nr:permease-like cell division protein FtsX [Lachnospiraceae bacterium]